MISGKTSGSGTYSYHERSEGPFSVMVSHMPEDDFKIRVVFRHHGETTIPIIKLSERDALLLWSCLKEMALDLNWDDDFRK